MQKTVLELKKIDVVEFKPSETKVKLKITYKKDDDVKEILKEVKVANPIGLVNQVLLEVKKKGKFMLEDNFSDDVLKSIYVTQFLDEDDVEEKLFAFFQDLNTEVSTLRGTKEARAYMKLLDQIKTKKIEF